MALYMLKSVDTCVTPDQDIEYHQPLEEATFCPLQLLCPKVTTIFISITKDTFCLLNVDRFWEILLMAGLQVSQAIMFLWG